jgi:hypothetical protein
MFYTLNVRVYIVIILLDKNRYLSMIHGVDYKTTEFYSTISSLYLYAEYHNLYLKVN